MVTLLILPIVLVVTPVWAIVRRRAVVGPRRTSADLLVFGGTGLTILAFLLSFVFGGYGLPFYVVYFVLFVAPLVAFAGLIVGLTSPKTASPLRGSRPESTRPYLAPAVWVVVGVTSGLAAVIAALIPASGCPSLIQWGSQGPLEQDYSSFMAGHDCSSNEAALLALVVALGILGAAAVLVGVIIFASRAGRGAGVPEAPIAASSAPAGWFTVADRPGELRWWDGVAWTDHYHRPE